MKKLVSLLLVVFMCASLGVVLTSCGASDPKTTVSAEEFAAAFNLDDNWEFVFEAENSAQQQKIQMTYKRDGNKFVATQTVLSTVDNSELFSYEQYGEIADNVFYMYWYDSEAEAYAKEASEDSVEECIADFVSEVLPDFLKDYSKFTYSEENKNYVAESLVQGEGEYATTLNNVTLAFEDGKIVSMGYSVDMGGATIPYVATIAYGDASVTLPTVAAE